MTETTERPQCVEQVRDKDQGGSFRSRYHQCPRAAAVERDGKPYCTQHDPEGVGNSAEARRRARRAELAKSAALWARDRAWVEACERWVETDRSITMTDRDSVRAMYDNIHLLRETINEAQAAYTAALGEQPR